MKARYRRAVVMHNLGFADGAQQDLRALIAVRGVFPPTQLPPPRDRPSAHSLSHFLINSPIHAPLRRVAPPRI